MIVCRTVVPRKRPAAGELGLACGGQCRAFFMPDADHSILLCERHPRAGFKESRSSKNVSDADLFEYADRSSETVRDIFSPTVDACRGGGSLAST